MSFSAPVEDWILGDPLEDVAQDVMTLAVEWHAAEPSEWRGDAEPRNHAPIEFARRATAYALFKLRDILEHGPGAWIQSKAGHNRTVALDGAPEPTATPNLAERLETIESLMSAVALLDAKERTVLERHLAWCEGRHDYVERQTIGVSPDGLLRLVDEVAPTQCGPTRRYARTCPTCGSVSPIVDRWNAPMQAGVAGRISDVLETAIRVRHAVVAGGAV